MVYSLYCVLYAGTNHSHLFLGVFCQIVFETSLGLLFEEFNKVEFMLIPDLRLFGL